MSRPWNLPEREVTPEAAVLSRRRWLKWAGLGAGVLGTAGAGGAAAWWWFGDHVPADEVLAAGRVEVPGADRYPAPRNDRFREVDRPLTAESDAARYCNF